MERRTFNITDWVIKVPVPTSPCCTDPPTYQEVTRAVNRCKAKASPCPLDQISVIVLKRCPYLRTVLHKLIVACWESGTLPDCWKNGFSILIYKKGDVNDPSNFRPITLQPALCKVFASILRDRLYKFVDQNNY